jgi:NitT/TauT family transport system substrate-binding protein
MGMVTATTTIRSISRGVPIVIVGTAAVPSEFYLFVRADSPIKTPKDMKGRSITVTRFGGLEDAYARFVAKKLGMEEEIKIVAAGGFRAAIAALRAGKVDGKIGVKLGMIPLMDKGEVRPILSVKEYLPKPWLYSIVFARKDFAANNPARVRRSVRAFAQSTRFIMSNRRWAIDMLTSPRYRYSEKVAADIYDLFSYTENPRINRAGVENVRSFLIDNGVLKAEKAPPVNELFTNRFVE